MLAELTSLCRQIVTLAPRSGLDGYGRATFGAGVAYRARLVGKRRFVLNNQGEQVLSTQTVYFAANPAIGAHDLLTLSTGDVNSTELGAIQPIILSVGRFPDDLGRLATVAYLA